MKTTNQQDKQLITQALIKIGAIGFSVDKPITFKSGILSPVYVDNRKLPFYPQIWKIVLAGLNNLINDRKLNFEIIAGVETAGIPHSSALSYLMGKPSVFVRKQVKDHGTKKMIEGGEVKQRTVLLLEDHITTGLSSMHAINSLRQEGGLVNDCVSITSYHFSATQNNFQQNGVNLHFLIDFASIFEVVANQNILNNKQIEVVQEWLDDPYLWTDKHQQTTN